MMLFYSFISCGDEEKEPINETPEMLDIQFSAETKQLTFRDGYPVLLTATISDNQNSHVIQSTWLIDGQEICPWMPIKNDGSTNCEYTPTYGDFRIELQAMGPSQQIYSETMEISVEQTGSPVVNIINPNGSVLYYTDHIIDVAAHIEDEEDSIASLVVQWFSSLDGLLSVEHVDSTTSFGGVYLSEGEHLIEITAQDTTGKIGSASKTISVRGPNNPPTCTIQNPSHHSIGRFEDQPIRIEAQIGDQDIAVERLQVFWSLDQQSNDLFPITSNSDGLVTFEVEDLSLGTHHITLHVFDEMGASCTDTIEYTITLPPSIVIQSPSEQIYNEHELVPFEVFVEDHEDASEEIFVQWMAYDGSILHEGLADTSGISNFSTSNFTTGQQEITVIATDSDGFTTSQNISIFINSLPTAPTLFITPHSPQTIDDITATAQDSIDEEGDEILYAYVWSNGNQQHTGTTLQSALTQKGDNWNITVTASDEWGTGDSTTQTVLIQNTPPTDIEVSISPNSHVFNDSTISCQSFAIDVDSTDVLTSSYMWSTGEETSEITLDGSLMPNSEIVCTSSVSDGEDNIEGMVSVVIENRPPNILEPTITPNTEVWNGSILQCSSTATDPDGENLVGNIEYHWTTEYGDLVDGDFFEVQGLQTGDSITCIASIEDGFGGTDQNEHSIVLQNSLPVIADISFAETEVFAGFSSLECQTSVFDADAQDEITVFYKWYVDEIEQIETSNIYTGNLLQEGSVIQCVAMPFDGKEYGIETSTTIIVSNTIPVVEELVFTDIESEVYTDSTLEITVEYSDVDTEQLDTMTVFYDWYVNEELVQSGTQHNLDGIEYFDKHDEIYVIAKAFDGIDYSFPYTSASISVKNSPPTNPELSLSPTNPYEGKDDVLCQITTTSTDLDDDVILYQYTWLDSNENIIATSEYTEELSHTLDKSQSFEGSLHCLVTASDGEFTTNSTEKEIEVFYDCFCPKIMQDDYAFTYWPNNFRSPQFNSIGHEQIRHVLTGFYGMELNIGNGSISKLDQIFEPEGISEAIHTDNSIIDSMTNSMLTYQVQIGTSIYSASVFRNPDELNSNKGDSNPSKLHDMGQFMQTIEIPSVNYENNTDVVGNLFFSIMPRHFVITHSLQSNVDITEEIKIQTSLTQFDFSNFTQEEWFENNRVLQISNENNEGWVFVVPDNGAIERASDGSISFTATIPTLNTGSELSLSVLVIPANRLSSSQLEAYIYPQTLSEVTYTQLNRQGNELQTPIPAVWDTKYGSYRIDLGNIVSAGSTGTNWNLESNHNLYNRHKILVTNNTTEELMIPLFMKGPVNTAFYITGGVPLFRDSNGDPTGLNVQVSKNWHMPVWWQNWFHLYSTPTIPQGTHELELTTVSSKWGETYAASHAQLSLVGWGVNQQWDESALGDWGESITYDPDMTLRRAMVDDVRPFLVDTKGQWNWTGNVGGADFLKYKTASGEQRLGRMRTQYDAPGPNLTDVVYAGISSDNKIQAHIRTHLGRTDDLVRAYYDIEYIFLEDVDYTRLSFFQVAADNYADNGFVHASYGNGDGVISDMIIPNHNSTGYASTDHRGIAIEGSNPWVFLWDNQRSDGNLPENLANVGYIVRHFEAEIGAEYITTPHINLYQTKNGGWSQYAFELGLPYDSSNTHIPAGSRVRVIVEYVIPPSNKSKYYGSSDYLLEMMDTDYNSTEMILYLANENEMDVLMTTGTLLSSYPITIDTHKMTNSVVAQFTVTGGLGYTPVVFKNLTRFDNWNLEVKLEDSWVSIDQSVEGDDYWQAQFDAVSNRYSLVFNIWNRGTHEYRLTR